MRQFNLLNYINMCFAINKAQGDVTYSQSRAVVAEPCCRRRGAAFMFKAGKSFEKIYNVNTCSDQMKVFCFISYLITCQKSKVVCFPK